MAMRNVLSPADLIQSAMNETFWLGLGLGLKLGLGSGLGLILSLSLSLTWKSPRCWRTRVTQTLARFRCSVNWPLKSAGLAAMAAASYVSTLVGGGVRARVRVGAGIGAAASVRVGVGVRA